MKFSTKAIHVGQETDPTTDSVIPPIYLTSTYKQKFPGVFKYNYTRGVNPNFTNLEKTLAALENAQHATIFSSGMGAITALLSLLSAGDRVLVVDDVYGGTYRLLNTVFKKFKVEFTLVDMQKLINLEAALQFQPQMVILESPTNPFLKIVDIEAITKLTKKYHVLSIVDNTFATPYLQNPISLGADVIVHSTTKYIGGHSDLVGGVVITNDQELKEKMDFARKVIGLNPSPFDAWMASRGVKTLAIRMEKHNANALEVANFLKSHPKVKVVHYPGLVSHKYHEIAKKQMKGFSGIISVEFDLSFEATKKLISSFKIFTLAESLGGVESLVDHPASMTHLGIPKEEREKLGLTDGLVRLSVGIEDIDDLLEDLSDALQRV